MGVLAGYPVREVQRAIQKGRPQMTVADLLCSPLPADMVKAQILTPPDPTRGQTELVLDPLEWVHAVVAQVPDRGLHLTRSYGACRCHAGWFDMREGHP